MNSLLWKLRRLWSQRRRLLGLECTLIRVSHASGVLLLLLGLLLPQHGLDIADNLGQLIEFRYIDCVVAILRLKLLPTLDIALDILTRWLSIHLWILVSILNNSLRVVGMFLCRT